MILIYSPHITPRLNYTADVVFRRVLKIKSSVSITEDKDAFMQYDGPKINYSPQPMPNAVHIPSSDFLFQTGVKQLFPGICHGASGKALFPTDGSDDFSYDVFAAVFYMVTRYEEYLPFEADTHGRFQPEHSIAYKHGFLDKPIVHYWVEEIKDKLQKHKPDMVFPRKRFRYVSTIDVDNGYAYKGKNKVKMMAAGVRDIFKGEWRKAFQRIQVTIGIENDPFDYYAFQKKLKRKYHFPMCYFVLSGQPSDKDHNLPPHSKGFQSLVRKIGRFSKIGIHPSYFSNESVAIIKKEIGNIETCYENKIKASRQHFIRLRFPHTYRQLIEAGVETDYSMGYPSLSGFRAGIAEPYLFYDLEQETITNLKIKPFQIIDTGLKDYQKLDSENALSEMIRIAEDVKIVNGLLISIFHDRTFAPSDEKPSWKNVYQSFIKSLY